MPVMPWPGLGAAQDPFEATGASCQDESEEGGSLSVFCALFCLTMLAVRMFYADAVGMYMYIVYEYTRIYIFIY